MRHIFLASLAAVSLGGAALAVPGIAAAAPDSDTLDDLTAVMGPAEDYQHGLTVNGVSPTLRSVVVDGETILAYCIEYWVQAADPDHQSAVTGWDEFTGDNNFKTDPQVREYVAWILRHSHPTLSLDELAATTGATGLTEAEAVAATQAAIWHFTDDFVADGNLTVDSAAHSNQPVSAASASNVQTVFDYFTGPENTGLSEHEVQASVTLVETTDAEVEPAQTIQDQVQDDDHILGPVALNASTEEVDLELTSSNAAVEIADLTMLDAAGEEIDTDQPVHAEELWLHVPADTETGGVQITAESTDFGYTGRLITPEPDDQRRFQTIVMVDETTHQATTELELNWEKAEVEPPPEPESPPTPSEPPAEEPPIEEPPVEQPPAEDPPVEMTVEEPSRIADPTPSTSPEETPAQDTPPAAAPEELARTGGTQTRNILVALATLAIGAALVVANRVRRKHV